MHELTAICPQCDNPIEVEASAQIGDDISCDNFPCFWAGEIEEIDGDGNVWFKNEDPINE